MQKQSQEKSLIFGVRYTCGKDIPKLEKLYEESGLELDYDLFTKAMKHVEYVVLSVEYHEKLVGHAVYEKKTNYINLISIFIDPYYRRNGAATAILEQIKSRGAFKLNKKMMFCVEESNLEMQLFLRAKGFVCTKIMADGRYKFQYEEKEND